MILLQKVQEEMKRRMDSEETLSVKFSPVELFCLIGNIQLALRHPENTGQGAVLTRQIGEKLQNILCPDPASALGICCSMGWDPANDGVCDGWTH